MSKRIVLLLPGGHHQILGLTKTEVPPVVLSAAPFISLVKVTARAAYYKMAPHLSDYTFNEGQK
jgi:hypothetical protein